jgi:ABC-type amino acid transport substrate-binding protein
LVEQEQAHLECGPNSISDDKVLKDLSSNGNTATHKGTIFSDPFFSSGTRFLVTQNNSNHLDLENQLKGIKLGVWSQTTTQEFLQQNYPDAEIVTFDSKQGKAKGIQAVTDGDVDALVSDRVLLTGEIDRQGLNPEDYQTIPDHPLTCDYYGLILPSGDPQWRNTVNTFIRDRTSKQVFDKWLSDYYPQAVSDLDYCQNRREE